MNAKLQHCSCGYKWEPTLWQKLIMLVNGEYVKTCPQCQTRLHLVLYNFVVCKERERIDKKELWRKA